MRVKIYSEKGIKTESTTELPKEIFEIKPNGAAMRQYLHVYQINQRRGTVATKTRGEVSGGGRKPWAQKGTGRARQGSTRSPIWVGGGSTHGPQPYDFTAVLPKRTRDLALRSALSEKAGSDRVFVVSEFAPKKPQTSLAWKLLHKLGAQSPVVVIPGKDEKISRSFRNIEGVVIETAAALNPYEVIRAKSVVLMKESIGRLESRLEEKSKVKAPSNRASARLPGSRSEPSKKVSARKPAKKAKAVKPAVKRTVKRSKKQK
ncbi:50S ribosomal protein L4 [candidate division WWE3 bacterium RBG_19FT_COMBO_53_11]|uniref:Large ribosomal subunit protein uL4 n=1 Tax=candidate division WWE3 bacterium RBG_19FT_COMBO_53_11 TaxID=1802613 RepID=A0A1F4UHF1_UNCKA|nr:MAG: 50S ribosomal protein L4 [candidate division WWE3 bacterium RBG_16_52_45]OGC44332.1 MAG: 50S ribosomal protein L4 [candidate division WWE3 bacterium RBG_19FT_COMBO_53_11]